MTLAAKINKDVTALTFDGWCNGNRFIGMMLRRPKKGSEERQFLTLIGTQMIISKDILDKYGIELTVQ